MGFLTPSFSAPSYIRNIIEQNRNSEMNLSKGADLE